MGSDVTPSRRRLNPAAEDYADQFSTHMRGEGERGRDKGDTIRESKGEERRKATWI